MKKIKIPLFLKELFGEETVLEDLILILISSFLLTLFIVSVQWNEISLLSPFSLILVILIIFDIIGGNISNFTDGTNSYYAAHPEKRQIYILVHVHPLILAFLVGSYWDVAAFVFLYSVISSFIVQRLWDCPSQKAIGAVFFMSGVAILLFISNEIPIYFVLALVFFLMKLIFSFSVNHSKK